MDDNLFKSLFCGPDYDRGTHGHPSQRVGNTERWDAMAGHATKIGDAMGTKEQATRPEPPPQKPSKRTTQMVAMQKQINDLKQTVSALETVVRNLVGE